MRKKVIIISLIVVAVIGLGLGGFFLVKHFSKGNESSEVIDKKEVVSSIFLDINPSLRLDLDKDKKVIDIIAINDDAKDVIYEDYKDKEYGYVIRKIANNLVEKGYTEDKVTVLISATGELETKDVFEVVKEEFNANNISSDLIIQNISESAKEIAKEYGISESKASYIEEMIKNNEELTFDDLKDKSVNELYEMKNNKVEEKKEETKKEGVKKEETKSTNNNSSNSSSNTNTSTNTKTTSYSCAAPSSNLKDPVWCDWYTKHPAACSNPYPEKKDSYQFSQAFISYIGINPFDQIGGGTTGNKLDSRASYCIVYPTEVYTKDYKYSALIDSVTGEFYDFKKEPMHQAKVTEEQALQAFLNANGITLAEIKSETTTGYQILLRVQDNANYTAKILVYNIYGQALDGRHMKGVTVDAMTGSVLRVS